MRGAIPVLPNTPSWRDARLNYRYNFTLTLLYPCWYVLFRKETLSTEVELFFKYLSLCKT
jgi:hypothetical protein